jgi:putative hemolysin
MKLNLIRVLAALAFSSSTALATEYIYRDLMANTLPSPGCAVESEAVATASKPYNIKNYSKKFCQTQGYGWHVEAVKNNGKAVCNECSGAANQGKKQCYLEDIVVTCKRIKPGSVGMLPGKS